MFRVKYSKSGSFLYIALIKNGVTVPMYKCHEMLRNGAEIKFTEGERDKTTVTLRHMLLSLEKNSDKGDTKLLNRIIRNGGYFNYIKELENERTQSTSNHYTQ